MRADLYLVLIRIVPVRSKKATSRSLKVVRNQDIDNFRTASEALYNAMIAEQNTSNAT